MYKNLKKIFDFDVKLLLVCLIVGFLILSIALITSFPYIRSVALQERGGYRKTERTLAQEELTADLLPAFKFNKYHIELKEKTNIELFLKPDSKNVKLEVIGAEGIGLGIDNNELIKKGLKIIKPKRPRNKISKRELLIESLILRTKAFFDLKEIEYKAQTINAIDFKIYKLAIEALLPGSYTIKATVDDKDFCTAKVTTKPEFRVDLISPNIIECGEENVISISGKGLNSLTQIEVEGSDLEVKDIEILEDGIAKVLIEALSTAEGGFRDLIVSSPIYGVTETLVDAIEVTCPTLTTGIKGPQGEPGIQGEKGESGSPGADGMSICENPFGTIMIFANNLPPGSQSSVFFDPVLCNLTFGIPVGYNGINATGATGKDGAAGMGICNNPASTLTISTITLSPGSDATSTYDPEACTLVLGIPKGNKGDKGDKG